MAYNEASFQLKMMLSSEFPHTKSSLLIDYPRKLQKFPAIRQWISTPKIRLDAGAQSGPVDQSGTCSLLEVDIFTTRLTHQLPHFYS